MAGQRNYGNQRGGAGGGFKMDDYVDVAERLVEFRAKYPDGTIQPVDPHQPYTVQEIGGQVFVVYAAAAYRTPDDPRPGIGTAWEPFPGKTPYTRDSELMNAETSAWGRAVMAVGAADSKRGIASAQEVRNRAAAREQQAGQQAQQGGQQEPPRNKDGSISRSQMSDEELAAAGAMTRQQVKDHNKLAKDVQGDGGADRANGTAADDEFYNAPPEPDGALAQALEDELKQVGDPAALADIAQRITVAKTQGKLSEEWLERLRELHTQTASALNALAGDAA